MMGCMRLSEGDDTASVDEGDNGARVLATLEDRINGNSHP
jgi:hypothetical protein